MKENHQQLSSEKDQVVREKEELQTANTRGQEQLRQQVSDIVTSSNNAWSLSASPPSAVSHEHC